MRPFIHHRERQPAACLVLVVMLFRAYVPVGFMPASGAPFLLEICPSGLDAQMPAHHHHHHAGGHGDYQNCPFGSAPATAPLAHLIAFEPPGKIAFKSPLASLPARPSIQILRSHRARAPPTPA